MVGLMESCGINGERLDWGPMERVPKHLKMCEDTFPRPPIPKASHLPIPSFSLHLWIHASYPNIQGKMNEW
ncbi:unnamed protein product, partial [Vitis vinifera]|uniref:Uncharacterized protein n=1 Tax=Vitis vinifera TaxID=29760 RepID=D7SMP0_VITVI